MLYYKKLMFLRVLMLIKQVHLRSALFATIGNIDEGFKFQPAVVVKMYG